MLIELQRAFVPEEMNVEEDCGICGLSFTVEVVAARALDDGRMDEGRVPGVRRVPRTPQPGALPEHRGVRGGFEALPGAALRER